MMSTGSHQCNDNHLQCVLLHHNYYDVLVLLKKKLVVFELTEQVNKRVTALTYEPPTH